MKLILEEYLKSLREKDELDLLICHLLQVDGYELLNKPKTGERQYGVDILAKKNDEILLFIIKQKDITRDCWDSGKDSVRPSLNDIFDVYLKTMLPAYNKTNNICIVLATNGYVTASVQPSWVGYQKDHSQYDGKDINYTEWTIDTLVKKCMELSFDEMLFNHDMQSVLRKALCFMEDTEDSKKYIEKIVDHYVELIDLYKSSKTKLKKVKSSFLLCITLLCKWAEELNNYGIAIDTLEYTMLRTWALCVKNEIFEDYDMSIWLRSIQRIYEKYSNLYISEVEKICRINNGFTMYNPLECRLLVYEIIGRMSTYGLYLIYYCREEEGQRITNILIELLNNNPAYKYPVYDDNAIEISLMFLLLTRAQRRDVPNIISALVQGFISQYRSSKAYPSPNDDFDEALQMYLSDFCPPYKASIYFGLLLEWACIEDCEKSFNVINEIIDTWFKDVTCQAWQLNQGEEIYFYSRNAAHNVGISVPFTEHGNLAEFKSFLLSINENVEFDKFSFNEYSFQPIAFIASRYFHCPVLPQFWRIERDR